MFDENVVLRFGRGFDRWLNPQLQRCRISSSRRPAKNSSSASSAPARVSGSS